MLSFIVCVSNSYPHTGEAQYVDDIPSPPDCLHAAFICSTKSLARVNDIKLKSSIQSDEVNALISYKDIPESGTNIGYMSKFGSGPLFADDITECVGQHLALVVISYSMLVFNFLSLSSNIFILGFF